MLTEAINLVGDSRAPVPSPSCGKQQVRLSGAGPSRRWDKPCPLVQGTPPRGSHPRPPTCWHGGGGQGDDDHHTCVITSAIGLAHQTFPGPSISIFKPFPPKHTASWFLFSCSEIQCVSQDLPAVVWRGGQDLIHELFCCVTPVYKRECHSVGVCQLKGNNSKLEESCTRNQVNYASLFKNYRFTVHDL